MLRAAHAKLIQLAMFFSSLHFASYCNINFKAKQIRCLEALYCGFRKDVVAVLPKGYGKIMILHLLYLQCYGISSRGFNCGFFFECADERSGLKNQGRKLESDDTWRQKKKKHEGAGALF